jgi:hexaprenyl-diphosphate synthase
MQTGARVQTSAIAALLRYQAAARGAFAAAPCARPLARPSRPRRGRSDGGPSKRPPPPHCLHSPRPPAAPANCRATASSPPTLTRPAVAAAFSATHPRDESWVPSLGIAIDGHSVAVDPFGLVARDLETMTRSVRNTVSVLQHPVLDRAASHLFTLHGKRLRPIIVILMAHATAVLSAPASVFPAAPEALPSLPPLGPLSGAAAAIGEVTTFLAGATAPAAPRAGGAPATPLLDSQLRLAEITEMIHAASLLHDDVIDTADSRRGLPTVNSVFGNQLAVLAGDFLLARASVALARLRDCDVVELLSTVIEHLVRGEVIQMNGGHGGAAGADARGAGAGGVGDASEEDVRRQRHYHQPEGLFESYMAKTFFKTASLMANSCRAVTMLAGHGRQAADAAYSYGEHVGLAFQLVDDTLDFTSSASALGKPVLDDLRQGHATAPVLFALDTFPDELGPMISRRFQRAGDLEAAVQMVERADGVGRTRDLAGHHARTAVVAISDALPPSDARSALINMADHVLTRQR